MQYIRVWEVWTFKSHPLYNNCIVSKSETTSGTAALLARDTDYHALAAGMNMFLESLFR